MTTKHKGMALAASGAAFWGCSGVAAQFVLQSRDFTPEWLTSVRMLLAGLLLLAFCRFRGESLTAVWHDSLDKKEIIIFSLFGMLLTQYSYYACIHVSNAPTATTLGYLMPVFMVVYVGLRDWQLPATRELFCVFLAVVGSAVLVTRGDFGTLAITPLALGFGLTTGAAQAVYTLQPRRLLTLYSPEMVVGWGVLLGGLFFTPIAKPWHFSGIMDTAAALSFAYIVVGGTVFAFVLYMASLRLVGPSDAAMTSCLEPAASVVISGLVLDVTFGPAELLGMVMILTAIYILARRKD